MKPKIRLADDAQLTKKGVSFGLDLELAKQMQAAASEEAVPLTLAALTRRLLLWALPHYHRAPSLWFLKQATVKVPKLNAAGIKGRDE